MHPEHVREAVRLSVGTLKPATGLDWSKQAGTLEWDCRATAMHLASCLVSYAGQLAGHAGDLSARPAHGYVPFEIHEDPGTGPDGLLEILHTSGEILTLVAAGTPPEVRAHHPYGASDATGFAAMGVVETLLHTHDVATGLGLDFTAPPELCAAALARLFRDAPTDTDPWATLLWATGRGDLPGRPRVEGPWRWNGTPAEDAVAAS